MTESGNTDPGNGEIYWDPYDPGISANPYPIYKRLRDEAPLYFNKTHDFYLVSRFTDVDAVLLDRETYSSARGDVLEFVKADIEVPKGMFIWEDPPLHTGYRRVLARAFTPRRMNELEGMIRAYCARCLDALIGAKRIDFLRDLGTQLPGGVIGMLLGIPESDQSALRERIDASIRTEAGQPIDQSKAFYRGEGFEDYIDWRATHPSDDMMTELLRIEFADETGVTRKLTRDEVLVFVNLLAGAGNETTSRLIGWIGKVLGDHPEQRRKIVNDRSLIPAAIEEILRFEPPGTQVARHVTRDVEIHGKSVPAGSVLLALTAAANRDDRRFENADCFDIERPGPTHITFGRGIHACVGAALARVEGRVALDEILNRFPDWTIDMDGAQLSSSSTTRGWDALPAYIG
jgi:cytochrome P450